jgi:hypothetical protein
MFIDNSNYLDMFRAIVFPEICRANNNCLLIIPVTSTCFGQLFCPKHVELIGIIIKQLLLHLVGCFLYYLNCAV